MGSQLEKAKEWEEQEAYERDSDNADSLSNIEESIEESLVSIERLERLLEKILDQILKEAKK